MASVQAVRDGKEDIDALRPPSPRTQTHGRHWMCHGDATEQEKEKEKT